MTGWSYLKNQTTIGWSLFTTNRLLLIPSRAGWSAAFLFHDRRVVSYLEVTFRCDRFPSLAAGGSRLLVVVSRLAARISNWGF